MNANVPLPITHFPPEVKSSFAIFSGGNRTGWLKGEPLRTLEAEWYEEGREARELAAKRARAMATFAKFNAFGMGNAKKKEEERKKALKELEIRGKDALKAAEGAQGIVSSSQLDPFDSPFAFPPPPQTQTPIGRGETQA